jgi:hypothetical protein
MAHPLSRESQKELPLNLWKVFYEVVYEGDSYKSYLIVPDRSANPELVKQRAVWTLSPLYPECSGFIMAVSDVVLMTAW